MKKIIAAILLIATLVICLASCNGGGNGGSNPSGNNGLIASKYIDSKTGLNSWRGTRGELDFTFDGHQDISCLADWHRISFFSIKIKKYAEINNTPLKKVKFDIVSDRNVTVYFACGQGGWTKTTPTASANLLANKKQTIEIPVNYIIDTSEVFYVCFATNASCWDNNEYRTTFFAEWYQTQYQITNLELYSK